jgi:hypothetical protein
MLFKFVSVCLLYISYYIIFENMLCNIQNNTNLANHLNNLNNTNHLNNTNNTNDVILTCDINNNTENIKKCNIKSILRGDIENGLYYTCNNKKNNLIEIISNVSYMSYNFFKNMKEIVYKKVNYLYPSNIKN